jgi:SAM-dependent methyltransferase
MIADLYVDSLLKNQPSDGEHVMTPEARVQREREFYNRFVDPARVEDAALLVPTNFARELEQGIVELAGHMAGKRVCDYGCGWGIWSAFFAQCGALVYSFDISDAHAALTRRAARVNRVGERVFAQVAAGEWLPFPDDFFDFVIGNAVLHHVDIALAAPEIYRVLKPGARAVFSEPLGENRLLEWARRCSLRLPNHRHSHDERALRYTDIRSLETFFDHVEMREIRLLRMFLWVLREFGIPVPVRAGWAARALERADDWLLDRLTWLRPLSQYVVVTLQKAATPARAELDRSSVASRAAGA